jgi:hypothetical protein
MIPTISSAVYPDRAININRFELVPIRQVFRVSNGTVPLDGTSRSFDRMPVLDLLQPLHIMQAQLRQLAAGQPVQTLRRPGSASCFFADCGVCSVTINNVLSCGRSSFDYPQVGSVDNFLGDGIFSHNY